MDKRTPDFDLQAEQIARPLRDLDDARKFGRKLLETAYKNNSRPEIAEEPRPLIGNSTEDGTASDEPPFYPRPIPPKWTNATNHIAQSRKATELSKTLDILAVVPVRVVCDEDLSHPAFAHHEDPEIGERVEIEIPRERVNPGEGVDVVVVKGEIASALRVVAYLRHCTERDEFDVAACECAWGDITGVPLPDDNCQKGGALAALVPAVRP